MIKGIPQDFASYLRQLLAVDGRLQREFALAIGRTSSQLSRALHRGKPFDLRVCFRLAQVTSRPPAEVLRAAGHEEVAQILENFYGPSRQVNITPDEERFLQRLRPYPTVRHNFEGLLAATEEIEKRRRHPRNHRSG